jgi:NDP-sugar pyrophosphorylase family protein
MDAMILAAGLGTRLRPLTDTLPKALVDVGGRPMLEHVARRLVEAGATRLIINAHHHADQIARFVEERNGFGVEVFISDESEQLLDTGGGLKHAARYFRRDMPFLLHNVDVFSDLDLIGLHRSQQKSDRLATLAVMARETSRYLLFDRDEILCGYGNSVTGIERRVRQGREPIERLGFSGVHAIDPRIFALTSESGAFSIIELYMRLAESGEPIGSFRIDESSWIDIGRPEQLARARQIVEDSLTPGSDN